MTLRALRKLLQGADPEAEVIFDVYDLFEESPTDLNISVMEQNRTKADGSTVKCVVIKIEDKSLLINNL